MKAVLFDMDGVIVDSMGLHTNAINEVLKPYKKQISQKELTEKYAGKQIEDIIEDIVGIKQDYTKIALRKEELTKQLMLHNLKPIQGIKSLLDLLKHNNYKIAIASGAPIDIIDVVLKKLQLEGYFEVISSGREVARPKPAPDVFTNAADKLQIPYTHCIVIEDGAAGIIGAKSVGMKTIGLTNFNRALPADKVIRKLSELTLRDF